MPRCIPLPINLVSQSQWTSKSNERKQKSFCRLSKVKLQPETHHRTDCKTVGIIYHLMQFLYCLKGMYNNKVLLRFFQQKISFLSSVRKDIAAELYKKGIVELERGISIDVCGQGRSMIFLPTDSFSNNNI